MAVPLQDLFYKISDQLVTYGRFRSCPGHAMIAIWRNEAQLRAWNGAFISSSGNPEEDVRFLTVPLELLYMIKIPSSVTRGQLTARDVTLCGIGFSSEIDLTDLQLYYYKFVPSGK